ncbi:MAG: nucleoside hydrolase [Okeania sp. SIO3H1]|nr:nucleoside hydrolase [Okeania sp. SIO3H1]
MIDNVNSTPLIFDDDGSQDGMTALAYVLGNPEYDVQAITIAQGIARPEIFVDNVELMLGRLGVTGIPVGVGRSDPLEGDNVFPDFIRDASDTFWAPFVTLPDEAPPVETSSAPELIVETINNSPEPVAILATGPLTNIAEALRIDPTIVDNISVLQIMGGAVFVEGNLPVLPDPPFSTNLEAEFNIWIDPVAAQEVFEFGDDGLNILLTPLDATNQIEFDADDYQAWLDTDTPESLIAAEFLDFALEVIQSDNDPNPVWDLVAAINLAEPEFSEETPLRIEIDTDSDPGDTQGDMIVVADGTPNVNVSLNPSFDNLSFDASEVFSALAPKATSGDDLIPGGEEDDLLQGLGGSDTIAGFAGDDELLGNRGNDSINGGAGDDTLKGGYENDTLKGGSGDDSLIGWIGNDALLGGSGEDTLSGGQGRDRLNGGEGDDTLTGGASQDKFIFAANQAFSEVELGVDEITDFVSGQDMILLDLTTFAAITTEAGPSLGDEFAIVDGEDLVPGSEAIIVYDSANSTLYYNPNGSEDGLGNGDRFAIFSNDASLTVDDFIIRA